MRNSISRDLSIRLSLMILIIGSLIGVSYSVYSTNTTREKFESDISVQTQNISSMLTLQLWLFDLETTLELCEHLISSSRITGIRVLDSDNTAIFNQGNFEGKNISLRHRELRHKDNLVGFLTIGFSTEPLSQHVNSLRTIGIAILLSVIISSFLLVNYLLKKHLRYPLNRLKNSMHKLSEGNFEEAELKNQKEEIQQIISSFNTLVERLKQRDCEILEKNTKLEIEVTERKKANQIFKALAEAPLGTNEQDIYDSIVTKTIELFNSDVAMLALLNNHGTAQILSLIIDGKKVTHDSHSIANSPCEQVLKQGYFSCSQGIEEQFPDTECFLDLNGLTGFVGITLKNNLGEIIGILSTLSRKPMIIPKQAREILDILQARAVVELERGKLLEENKVIELKLRQAQKMEAIGTLAGGIAHDFNNVLTAIMGYAEMARDEVEPDSEIAEDLDNVLEGGERAKELVKQILAFSRQTDTEKIVFQPASVVKEAQKMLRSSIPATIEMEQDIDPLAHYIYADPTQLHQILLNLCTNAFHAMEESGGVITISLQNRNITPLEQSQELQAGQYVELAVTDTGKGIPPEIQSRIFEPYFTTKDIGKGTGMGLAIIHGIVQDYEGAITVESTVDKGTVIRVFFPATQGEKAENTRQTEAVIAGSEKILFVDDEEILVNMGETLLGRLGYVVTKETNSTKALEIFSSNPHQYDLVITDQTMPQLTGAEFSRKLLAIRPDLPIILCTGYSTIITAEDAKEIGIKEFLLKPVSRQLLATTVRKVLDNR